MSEDETIRYKVTVLWRKRQIEVFKDVVGFSLDNDVYFFYINNVHFLGNDIIKTIWLKNEDLTSVEIEPYKETN